MIKSSVMLTPVAPMGHLVELARLAEELGYSRIWVPDEGLASRDVFVVMAAMAAATDTIQIGTGIVNPYSRHPALTTSAVASIDELSGGRAFLGYGAGGSLTLGPLGIERPRPLVHVREAIELSRRLFAGEPVDMDGETVSLQQARVGFARADTEIWFAGRGPRMLRQAGGLVDGVLLEFLHKPTLGDYVAVVNEGAERTGNTPTLCYATMVITNPARLEEVRPHMTYRLVDSPPKVKELLGITEADTAAIAKAMHNGLEAAAELIPDEWVDPFVISGTVDACAAELSGLMSAHGFSEFMLVVTDMDGAATLMTEVAEVVAATVLRPTTDSTQQETGTDDEPRTF
ncbi:MAG: LLM class flavin-dependent oxidoreductase [Acidimicrobiales bacterium]